MSSKLIKSALIAAFVAFMATGCNTHNTSNQPIDMDPNSNPNPSTDQPQSSVLYSRR